MTSFAKKFLAILIATEIVWAALLAFAPSTRQMRVFFLDVDGWFCDYLMPRICADSARTYVPEGLDRYDACYPPICYDFVKLFPKDIAIGGVMNSCSGAAVLMLGLVALLRKRRMSWQGTAATALAVLCSWPAMNAVGVSNQMLFAAGFICLFFAWHEDDAPLWGRFMPLVHRRHAALACLSLAIAMKLTPVFFSLWLVRSRRWCDFVVVGILSAALVFVPFAWHDGFAGFLEYLESLRLHADMFTASAIWGAPSIARYIALAQGVTMADFRVGCGVWRIPDIAIGAVSLWLFFRSRRGFRQMLFLVTALLVLPGDNLVYTILLLLPLVAMLLTEKGLEPAAIACLLLPCFVPIRVFWHGGVASNILPALSLYAVWLLSAVLELGEARLTNNRGVKQS